VKPPTTTTENAGISGKPRLLEINIFTRQLSSLPVFYIYACSGMLQKQQAPG
jgi:hypothetical protein